MRLFKFASAAFNDIFNIKSSVQMSQQQEQPWPSAETMPYMCITADYKMFEKPLEMISPLTDAIQDAEDHYPGKIFIRLASSYRQDEVIEKTDQLNAKLGHPIFMPGISGQLLCQTGVTVVQSVAKSDPRYFAFLKGTNFITPVISKGLPPENAAYMHMELSGYQHAEDNLYAARSKGFTTLLVGQDKSPTRETYAQAGAEFTSLIKSFAIPGDQPRF